MSVWQDLDIPESEIFSHSIGPVTLYFQRHDNELWIASKTSEEAAKSASPHGMSNTPEQENEKEPNEPASISSDPLKWNRWALHHIPKNIAVTPVFPDRSVVVKPEFPFKIGKSAQAKIYTRIPVFIRISPSNDPDHIITEIPSLKITGTWFGDFLSGELCYWITSKARRKITEDLYEPHLVICPISITNTSKDDLPIDKMSLNVEKMSIYQQNGVLWADQTNITFLGGDKHSDIEMSGRAPEEAKHAKLLSKPRVPVKRSIAVRTFRLIKDLQNFTSSHI